MPLLGARATASRAYFGEKQKPGAPIITSSTPGVSSLSIAFTAPVFNGGLSITRYEQAYSTDNSTFSPWALASSATTPPTSPVTVSGLTNGQAYFVKIRAVNNLGAGPESNVWNTTTTPRTTPPPPTLTSITRGYRQLTLAFTAPGFNGGSDITNYEFSTNNGASWTSMGQSGTADYTITSLADFTSYNVRVRAVNAVGPGTDSNTVISTTAGVTNAPINLNANSGVGQSPLSWTAPDPNGSAISDYIVQYSTSSNFSSAVTTFADGLSASAFTTVTGLAASTTYYFRVASVNQVGQSGWSSIASAATAGVPSQMSAPTSSAGDRTFTISWSTPANNGSAISSYTVQYSLNGGVSWSTAETFSSGSTEFTNRSKSWVLNNGPAHIGRVLATNAVGGGTYSSASAGSTPTFAIPSLTPSASYNSESTPNERRIEWSVNPTDVRDSTTTAGTTTRIYLQRMVADGTWQNASHGEQLVATYTGNQTYSGGSSSFTTSGTVAAGQQYRIRAEQFSTQDTGYVIVTGWTNLAVIGQQSRQPDSYLEWSPNYPDSGSGISDAAEVVYTTGNFVVEGSGDTQLSGSSIPGVSTNTEGSVQYSIRYLNVNSISRGNGSASTSARHFFVDYSGTSTTLPYSDSPPSGDGQRSSLSYNWPGASNNEMNYTFNINPDTGFGNAGAGRVRVTGNGNTTFSSFLDVKITAYGNKRTRVKVTPAPVTW
jgi:hypothetical protein